MYNDLFSIGPFTVHGYGLMTAIGIISAYLLMEHLAKKKGLDEDRIFWLLIWCLIFGYIGSKILYIITIIPAIIEDPSLLKHSLTDGWVMYGGLLGGILGGHLYCRRSRLNAWAYFDIGLCAVILAQAFGRIGCFLAGCCYGAETDSAFHIVFTRSNFAPNNVPLIPTQLIMSAGDFLLFAFLMIYDKKKKNEGQVTGAYLTLYSLGRFAVEFFRGDVARGSVGPLSTSQFIALFVAAFGIFIWIRRAKSGDGLYIPETKTEPEAKEVNEDKEPENEAAEERTAEEKAEAAEEKTEATEEAETEEPEAFEEADAAEAETTGEAETEDTEETETADSETEEETKGECQNNPADEG